MKLEVVNLKKQYSERVLFDNFNYVFNNSGLYILVGDSGCGKSTILNMLSTLDKEYEGKILYNNIDLKTINKQQSRDLRLHDFGFVFQSFNLLEDDTVLNNIRMNLDSLSNQSEEYKNKRIEEVINLLDLNEIQFSYVKNISGGEKQRVAIARAIIHSPLILFCDEPTGSLDQRNSEIVFKMLKKLSKETLIITVTHDLESAKKYGDFIMKLDDKKITVEKNNDAKLIDTELYMMNVNEKRKEGHFSLKCMFSHIKAKFKERKLRYIFRNLMFSLCLISSSLAITLTSSLNSSISSAFSSIVSEKSVVLTKKNSVNSILDFYSVNKNKIYSLMNDYKNELDYYGVTYVYDFENGFEDGNDLYMVNGIHKEKLQGFSARTFNEYTYVNNWDNLTTYPIFKNELENDEIVLSITYDQMKEICLSLQIMRDFNSLGNYLSVNDFFVSLELSNKSWQYSDEQLFKVKAFVLDNKNRVYHTNPLFNEILFEEQMRFPSSNKFNKVEELPWVLKRLIFVHSKKQQSDFLNKIFYDTKYEDLLFENDSNIYSPLTCSDDLINTNKLFVFETFKDSISISILDNLNDINFKYEAYYFSTNGGYYNNGTSVFTGFAKPTFFSTKLEQLEEIIDAHSMVDEKDLFNIAAPKGVVNAYAFNTNADNVKIKVSNDDLKIDEIKISEGFAGLLQKQYLENEFLYATMMYQSERNGDRFKNKFRTIKIKIKGIVDGDNSISLYHNKDYSLSLFRDIFKVSTFDLIPNSIVFELDHIVNENELKKLNSYFAGYEFKNPLIEISESINESTSFLRILLFVFSIISIVSSLLLSLIITLINAKEEKREISLFIVLGYRNSEISKLYFLDNLIHSCLSLCLSFVSLIFINILLGKSLGSVLGVASISLISPVSILSLILITIIISFVSNLSIFSAIRHNSVQENIH